MQSPISGSFGGLPPHNQPFRGCQLSGETLVIATSLLLSPTAEVTAVWCDLELQLGFSLVPSSFLFPPFFPPCVLRFVLLWRLLHGCLSQPVYQPGCSVVGRNRRMGGAGGARKAGTVCLPVRSLRPAVAQTIRHSRNPFLPQPTPALPMVDTVVIL